MLSVERLEQVVVVPVTGFQLPPVLEHVNILQSVIVGINVVFVASLSEIQHTLVNTININDSRHPCLPVKVAVFSHRPLYDGISHVQIVKVISCIPQTYRLEIVYSRFLLREEFVCESFCAESFVCVYGE